MTCDKHRHRLGEYLTEALDDAERSALERHLSDCSGCAAELGELRELEDVLTGMSAPADFAAPPSRRSRAWWMALAAAAVVGLAVGGWALFGRPDSPEIVRGSLRTEQTLLQAGDAVPYGEPLVVGDATVATRLAKGSTLEAHPSSELELLDAQSVRVRRGRVFFHVAPEHGRFRVHTPQGHVDAVGTTFTVDVNPAPRDRFGLPLVSVRVASGALVFVDHRDQSSRLTSESQGIAWEGGLLVKSIPTPTPDHLDRPDLQPVRRTHKTPKPDGK